MLPLSHDDLFPSPRRHPYYIVAPAYTHFSSGIRLLHLLCHSLNRQGYPAFMVGWHTPPDQAFVNTDLVTPVLSSSVARNYGDRGLTPIVVYPEVVSGNPLNAPLVVRYVLNYPGQLGGDRDFPPGDICYSHLPELAKLVGQPDNLLSPPLLDTSIFYPPPPGQKRSGTCFYARKFRILYPDEPLPPQVHDSIEIKNMTLQETAEIYRRCELIYCLENTAASSEAMLCGCPAVLLPNIHLTNSAFSDAPHLGNGYAWGDDPTQIEHAKATVGRVRDLYLATFPAFLKQLERFVHQTQKAASHESSRPIRGSDLPMLGDWDYNLQIMPEGHVGVVPRADRFDHFNRRLDHISATTEQIAEVMRPVRSVWRRMIPLRRIVAKLRGRI